MAEDPLSGFVTISEAAHLLGVSERTVQRRVAKLTDSDRQTTDSGRVLVRRAALGLTDKADAVEEKPDRQGTTSDGQPDRQATDRVTDSRDELIEQLRSENGRLWEALSREQAIAMTATSDASELRRKLEALTDGLIEASSAGNPRQSPEDGKPHAVSTDGAYNGVQPRAGKGFWGSLRARFGGGDR